MSNIFRNKKGLLQVAARFLCVVVKLVEARESTRLPSYVDE